MNEVTVDKLFVGPKYKTEVWVSKMVAQAFSDLLQAKSKSALIVRKMEHYAIAGFINYEGRRLPIRHEGNGVYRIGLEKDLFRVIGFYTSVNKKVFIAMETIQKHGKKLRGNESDVIYSVACMKKNGLWEYAK